MQANPLVAGIREMMARALGADAAQSADNDGEKTEVDGLLSRDAFLKLLTAQLRYQDPLQPMEDSEFLNQLAQLRTMEQTENLNQNIQRFLERQQRFSAFSGAVSLIGRQVTVEHEGVRISGTPERVLVDDDGRTRLQIKGELYDYSSVVEVGK